MQVSELQPRPAKIYVRLGGSPPSVSRQPREADAEEEEGGRFGDGFCEWIESELSGLRRLFPSRSPAAQLCLVEGSQRTSCFLWFPAFPVECEPGEPED